MSNSLEMKNIQNLKPDDLLTPAQVLAYFPQFEKLGFYQGDIGNFRRVFALSGEPVSKKTGVRVTVASVVRLLRLINFNLNEMVFDFDKYPNLNNISGPDYGKTG